VAAAAVTAVVAAEAVATVADAAAVAAGKRTANFYEKRLIERSGAFLLGSRQDDLSQNFFAGVNNAVARRVPIQVKQ
jgi:hypothetical protein